LEATGSMCAHIDRFYDRFAAPAKVYWPVQLNELPTHKIEPEPTELGDHCHYNIVGLSTRQAEKYFRNQNVKASDCKTCEGTTERDLTLSDLVTLRERYPPKGNPHG
jgi:hypothetical protein